MTSHVVYRSKSNTVPYRKGWIEVSFNIHPDCLNIETWNTDPDVNIDETESPVALADDSAIVANTEIELTADQARTLAHAILDSLSREHSSRDG